MGARGLRAREPGGSVAPYGPTLRKLFQPAHASVGALVQAATTRYSPFAIRLMTNGAITSPAVVTPPTTAPVVASFACPVES